MEKAIHAAAAAAALMQAAVFLRFSEGQLKRIQEAAMINEPSEPIDRAGPGVGGGAACSPPRDDRYELLSGDGMYVGLCHRVSVQVEVKSRGGRTVEVNQVMCC